MLFEPGNWIDRTLHRYRLAADPLSIGYDALMRPSRFATFLGGERRHRVAAVVATIIWVGATFVFVGLIVPLLIPVKQINLAIAIFLTPWLSMAMSGLYVITGDKDLAGKQQALFWLLRCQLAITPLLTVLFLCILQVASTPLSSLTTMVMLILVGLWPGGALTVRLVRTTFHTAIAPTRWVLAGGIIISIALMWWSPIFPVDYWCGLFLILLGFALGLIRPLSWLWEMPLALLLVIGSQCGLPAQRLRALHPVTLDELSLMPLPGLQVLLARACHADMAMGCAWLLDVAVHPGQGGAALGAVRALIRRGTLAHPLLLWLSTHPDGQHWLHRQIAIADRLPPLLRGYVALMDVNDAGAWPGAIARHRPAFEQAQPSPDGSTMLVLLDTALAVLTAARWPDAAEALRQVPMTLDACACDYMRTIDHMLHTIAHTAADEHSHTQPFSVPVAPEAIASPRGWPGALLEAMAEHLVFLLTIEGERASQASTSVAP